MLQPTSVMKVGRDKRRQQTPGAPYLHRNGPFQKSDTRVMSVLCGVGKRVKREGGATYLRQAGVHFSILPPPPPLPSTNHLSLQHACQSPTRSCQEGLTVSTIALLRKWKRRVGEKGRSERKAKGEEARKGGRGRERGKVRGEGGEGEGGRGRGLRSGGAGNGKHRPHLKFKEKYRARPSWEVYDSPGAEGGRKRGV